MKEKCSGEFECMYSKSMDQPYPRLCVNCGIPEESTIDHESIRISRTNLVSLEIIGKVIQLLQLRNEYVQRGIDFPGSEIMIPEIKWTNENIKQLLNL